MVASSPPGHDQEVAPPPRAEERHEVRQQAVDRLDEPRDRGDPGERGELAGGEAALLEHDRDDLLGQVDHALGEVDDREEEREPAGLGALERVPAHGP
jgi:hypothetical protein